MPTPKDKARMLIDQVVEQSGLYASSRQPNTKLATIYPQMVLRPTLEERPEIMAEVERCLFVIKELEASVEANLTRADRLRQFILKRAFEGKLSGARSQQQSDALHERALAAEALSAYGATQ